MIIFYYKNMILGGAELLMIRLAKTMMKLGKKCCIFAESIDDNLLNQICENDIDYKIVSNSEKRINDFIRECEDVCYYIAVFRLYSY